jgi:cytochrome c oxidase subunit 1
VTTVPAVAGREPLAPSAAVLGRRVGGLYVGTGLALFALMGVLGLLMRLSQADVIALGPAWFYRVMTLHGAGMLAGLLLAQMGVMWFALRDVVPLDTRRALAAYGAFVVGAVLVVVAVLFGGFASGWTFLWPLPFLSQGAWDDWASGAFLVGLLAIGAGFMVYCIDVLSAATARFGGLGRTLGLAYLRGRDDDPPPPQVIGGTVVALEGLIASVVGATILAALLGRLLDPEIAIDALWAKNLTYFFGHSYANLIIYLAVGGLYVLLPQYAGRPWKTTKPIVIGWMATLVFVATAYSHHLYMDFVQPTTLQVVSYVSSSGAAVPVLVVTIFTGMMLVWGSRYRWTLASTLLYLGFAGWAIGGAAAVIDSIIAVNFRLHNTVWVPAHFHTYLLLAVVFWSLAVAAHFLERAAGRGPRRGLLVGSLALMLAGGYGLVGVWYAAGALGVPRRYAVQPFGTEGWSLAGSAFTLVFAAGFLLLLLAFAELARAARTGGSAHAEAEDEPEAASPEEPAAAAPVESPASGWTLTLTAAAGTVALVSLLPPVVEAAEENVRWHHLVHAAMILSGAALAFAAASVPGVWARLGGRFGDAAVVLVVLAPVVAMLAMTPRYYEAVEDSPLLHFGYHLVVFFGLGALTGLAAAALGRVPGWTLLVLSSGMGVLYAAGVLGS